MENPFPLSCLTADGVLPACLLILKVTPTFLFRVHATVSTRTTCRSWLSLSTWWVPRMEMKLSGLAASAHWALLPLLTAYSKSTENWLPVPLSFPPKSHVSFESSLVYLHIRMTGKDVKFYLWECWNFSKLMGDHQRWLPTTTASF